ncbi:hypothetical protein QTP70_000567 [Hemibagrus guttatus]|uniref:Uncharacterized protein n=1 Tax=Hemibagrus guttatus TaxID=175788 RepID=A0AAE0URB5_9TELE|nr:hypothetical protein QTP70_000567 [Hemibagrus guttatus]
MCECGVSDEACAALSSNPSHLRDLNLSWNNLGDSGVKSLSAVLENPHCNLEKLRLCECDVSDEGCAALTSALRSNPSHLKELDLTWNNLGDSGVKSLSAVLENPYCKLETLGETGRKVLGVSSGRRKDKETWWWNEEVQDSIQRKRLAKKKWDMDRTEENRQEYKELQRRVKREVSKAKQKAYDELYTRLDTREGEKDLYRLARQRDRDEKDVQQVRVIKDRDGRVLTSEESVQRRWKEYFEELMNEENEREKKSRRVELCGTESR